jgi:IS30 family transposase
VAAGRSLRAIAEQLSRSPSTISRELRRNGGIDRYRATEAQSNAKKRARRRKVCLLTKNQRLYRLVRGKLLLDWFPEQISGWLERTYPDDKSQRVSHETIYKSLFIQTSGIFRKELRKHQRSKRKFRHAKPHSPGTRGRIIDGVSISERPPGIEDRAVPGHWEGDLIVGSNNSQIATLAERQTRYTVLVKVKSKKTDDVVSALSRQMNKLPVLLQQSLTWDRGTEMASHAKFPIATDIDVYFCDPQSPW